MLHVSNNSWDLIHWPFDRICASLLLFSLGFYGIYALCDFKNKKKSPRLSICYTDKISVGHSRFASNVCADNFYTSFMVFWNVNNSSIELEGNRMFIRNVWKSTRISVKMPIKSRILWASDGWCGSIKESWFLSKSHKQRIKKN